MKTSKRRADSQQGPKGLVWSWGEWCRDKGRDKDARILTRRLSGEYKSEESKP